MSQEASQIAPETESSSQPDVEPKPPNTSTPSQHDLDKKTLEELSRDMIKSTGEYIKGEIELCVGDYKLLEQMNKLVTNKYKHLSQNSSNIIKEMDQLNDAYAQLLPLLGHIDSVEKSVDELEVTATKLDAYSKRLEAKFKQFTERINNR